MRGRNFRRKTILPMLPEILVGWVRGEGIRESTFGGVGVGLVSGEGRVGSGEVGDGKGDYGLGMREGILPPAGSHPCGATLGSGPAADLSAQSAFNLPPSAARAVDAHEVAVCPGIGTAPINGEKAASNFARGCGAAGDPQPVGIHRPSSVLASPGFESDARDSVFVCAWCEPGRVSAAGHGICARHKLELEAQRASMDWRGK